MSDQDSLSVLVTGKDVGLTALLQRVEAQLRRADSAAQGNSAETLRLASSYARLGAALGQPEAAANTLRSTLGSLTGVEERQSIAIQTQIARLEAQASSGSRVQQVMQGLTGAAAQLGIALALPQLVQGAAELAQTGAQAQLVEIRFNQLATAAGTTGQALITALRSASGGEISDLNLQLAANRANMLGVATSAEQLSTLLAIARDRAQTLGTSTSKAFDDLVTGLGRGSALILDNLGIIVSEKEANEQYAAAVGKTVAQLTEQEKKQALINTVVAQGKATLAATGGAAESTAGTFARLGTAAENAKVGIGELLAAAAAPIASGLADIVGQVKPGLDALRSLGDKQAEVNGKLVAGSTTYEQYTASLSGVNQQIRENSTVTGALISQVPQLTQAQFQYVQALVASGQSYQSALQSAQTYAVGLQNIEAAQRNLTASGDLSAAGAAQLAQQLSALIGVGDGVGATVAALADAYNLGQISAEQLAAALAQLQAAQLVNANAAAVAATEDQRLARGKQEVASSAGALATAIDEEAGKKLVAQVNSQALAAEEDRLKAAAQAAAAAITASGGNIEAEAARLAASSSLIDQLTAAYLRLNAASGKNVTSVAGSALGVITGTIKATSALKEYGRAMQDRTLATGSAAAQEGVYVERLREAEAQFGKNSIEAYRAQTDLERFQQQQLKSQQSHGRARVNAQQQVDDKLTDQEAQYQDRLTAIAEDGARKRAEAEKKYNQDRLDSRAGFYEGLADVKDQGLAQQLSAEYEAAAAKAQEIARTQGADAADAYLQAAEQAIQKEGELRAKIAALRSDKTENGDEKSAEQKADDANRAAYLEGVLKLQQDADAARLKAIEEGGSAIAAEQARQYAEAEKQYSDHLDRLERIAQRKGVSLRATIGGPDKPPPGEAGAAPVAQPSGGGLPPSAGGAGAVAVADVATPAAVDAQTSRLEAATNAVRDAVADVAQRVSAVERAVGNLSRSKAFQGG